MKYETPITDKNEIQFHEGEQKYVKASVARKLEIALAEANESHGKTLLMCEQTINKLRDQLKLNTRRRDA